MTATDSLPQSEVEGRRPRALLTCHPEPTDPSLPKRAASRGDLQMFGSNETKLASTIKRSQTWWSVPSKEAVGKLLDSLHCVAALGGAEPPPLVVFCVGVCVDQNL